MIYINNVQQFFNDVRMFGGEQIEKGKSVTCPIASFHIF